MWISHVFVIGVLMVGVNITAKQLSFPIFLRLKSMLYLISTVSVGVFLFSVSSSNIHICYRLGYAGKVKVDDSVHSGTICQVVAQLPQVFHRMESQKLLDLPDARFQYFVDKVLFPFVSPIISVTLFLSQVLPAHTGALMAQTLIYVPSYFDFIRLRNYMKKEEINFTHLNE